MENVSIPNTVNSQAFTGTAAPQTDTQHAQAQMQRIAESQESGNNSLENRNQDQARFDAVKKAALQIVSTNPLSPSSARFTIYRDTLVDGVVFVTRFTSISDGKVTLVREPELLGNVDGNKGSIIDGTA
jgi:hypothetical protein